MNHSRALIIAAMVALIGRLTLPMVATAADLAVNIEQDPNTGETVVTVMENRTGVDTVGDTDMKSFATPGVGIRHATIADSMKMRQ